MDLELTGRRVLVTASSAGIGASIARLLAHEGCAVLVHGRDATRAAEVAEELRAMGAIAEVTLGDLTVDTDATRVAQAAQEWDVEVLVNNAGPFAEHTWDDAEPAAWLEAFNGNVVSAVRMTQALVPAMRTRGWGRVINVGSRAATTPLPNMVEYSAAKAAVVNMTTNLAQHLAGSGITANTVSPGVTLTDGLRRMFTDRLADHLDDHLADRLGEQVRPGDGDQVLRVAAEYAPNPSGRLGTGEDIAHAVAYLASPHADYVNGIDLRVDGGITPVP